MYTSHCESAKDITITHHALRDVDLIITRTNHIDDQTTFQLDIIDAALGTVGSMSIVVDGECDDLPEDGDALIERLDVKPQYRRCGYGRAAALALPAYLRCFAAAESEEAGLFWTSVAKRIHTYDDDVDEGEADVYWYTCSVPEWVFSLAHVGGVYCVE